MLDIAPYLLELLSCLEGEQTKESLGRLVVRTVVGGDQGQRVVVFVLGGEGIAVLPVDVHEDGLNDHAPVGVVEGFVDVAAASHPQHFLPLLEIQPLVLE